MNTVTAYQIEEWHEYERMDPESIVITKDPQKAIDVLVQKISEEIARLAKNHNDVKFHEKTLRSIVRTRNKLKWDQWGNAKFGGSTWTYMISKIEVYVDA